MNTKITYIESDNHVGLYLNGMLVFTDDFLRPGDFVEVLKSNAVTDFDFEQYYVRPDKNVELIDVGLPSSLRDIMPYCVEFIG